MYLVHQSVEAGLILCSWSSYRADRPSLGVTSSSHIISLQAMFKHMAKTKQISPGRNSTEKGATGSCLGIGISG
jgi:hypothetical protein